MFGFVKKKKKNIIKKTCSFINQFFLDHLLRYLQMKPNAHPASTPSPYLSPMPYPHLQNSLPVICQNAKFFILPDQTNVINSSFYRKKEKIFILEFIQNKEKENASEISIKRYYKILKICLMRRSYL